LVFLLRKLGGTSHEMTKKSRKIKKDQQDGTAGRVRGQEKSPSSAEM